MNRQGTHQIAVLTNKPLDSSLGRYAVNLFRAISPLSKFVQIKMSSADRDEQELGATYKGIDFGSTLVETLCAHTLPKLMFRDLADWLRSWQEKGNIIHYSSLDVPYLGDIQSSYVTVHDNPNSYFKGTGYRARLRYRIMMRLRLEATRQSGSIVAVSRHVASGLHDFNFNRVRVVYPAVSPEISRLAISKELARSALSLPLEGRLLLSVSSSEPRKNLPMLQKLSKSPPPNTRVVRVGPAVAGAINFTDISSSALSLLYRACDLLFFPSLEEGFGSPVAEALTCGLPVVCSDIDVMREVTDGAGVFFDPHDFLDAKKAVIKALRGETPTPDTMRSISERYSLESLQKSLCELYASGVP